ncbi:MAG: membrane protein insertion efficiency factor YidD [Rhodoglobus sp.]
MILVLSIYRKIISPLYGDVCRYYPTCSHYTLQAIQHHGACKGMILGIIRIGRCHPWAEGGIDDISTCEDKNLSLNRFGFVVPTNPLLRTKERAKQKHA